jgi:hypothetical protein
MSMLEQEIIEFTTDKGIGVVALFLLYRLFSTHLKENTKNLIKVSEILNRIEGKLNGKN